MNILEIYCVTRKLLLPDKALGHILVCFTPTRNHFWTSMTFSVPAFQISDHSIIILLLFPSNQYFVTSGDLLNITNDQSQLEWVPTECLSCTHLLFPKHERFSSFVKNIQRLLFSKDHQAKHLAIFLFTTYTINIYNTCYKKTFFKKI